MKPPYTDEWFAFQTYQERAEEIKKGRPGPPFSCAAGQKMFLVVVAVVIAVVVSEVEQIEEIADGGTIERHIGIIVGGDGVRKIIAAAMR